MKMKLLYVPMVMAVMSALVVTNSGLKTTKSTPWTRTTGPYGLNLNGKMFTLSLNRGEISFFPPNFSPSSPSWTSRSYTTTYAPWTTTTSRHRTTTTYPSWTTTTPHTTTTSRRRTTTTYAPWTTTTRRHRTTTTPHTTTTSRRRTTTTYAPWTTTPKRTTTTPHTTTPHPTRGVSVCLRYLIDQQTSSNSIFTLSPSSTPLKLGANNVGWYTLYFGSYSYYNLDLHPDIRFWSNIGPDIWNRVCLTVDTVKNVAQVFRDSSISIRKMLPANVQYVWSGEPVIDFSGFDGQVTDVQVWDYPLRYKEIFNYMTSGFYLPYCGSVLTWSSINYSPRGNTLLEDAYEWHARQPISSKRRGHRPKGEKKMWEFINVGERDERKTEQL
ncbi:uncharacterized protein LOC122882705 [Siniperca chuatsi]|uniref:uncharacterized protein LOC122882705 n=1 Tax=Siniperca chuatsi TaxID=119488 RepID=UPI001CE08D3E|nr:uncharacterized protein LOC122882705 [Siniperca chuatsi]